MSGAGRSPVAAVLMLGLVSQVAQVLLLRELLMAFAGSELSIGLILAAWLAWVGVGSRTAARLVDAVTSPHVLLVRSALGVTVALPATILVVRALRGLFDVAPGAYLSLADMVVSCAVLMAPTCLLLGLQFVVLSRLWREADRVDDTSGAGKAYIGEAVGNVAGGVLFTLVMVRHLSALQAAAIVTATMVAVAMGLAGRSPARGPSPAVSRRRVVAAVGPLLLVVLAVAAFPALERLDAWAYGVKWSQFAPAHKLVGVYQSKHGAISVLQRADQFSLYQSGHLVFSTAGPDAPSPELEDQEAVLFAHLAMVQHPAPQRVLLIGGGLRGILREIARHPVVAIDYVELDEVLTVVAMPYVSPLTLASLADPRVSLVHGDGRLFVKTARQSYDLIIVDAPDPTTAVLNRYYTREFFAEARALLSPGGVLVTGAVSTPDLRGTAVANRNATIYHTLSSVFARVLTAGDRLMFFFASDSPDQASLDVTVLTQRYLERGVEAPGFSPHHYQTQLQEAQLRRVNWVVRNHGRSPTAHLEGPGAVPLLPPSVPDQERTQAQLPPVAESYFINADLRPVVYYYSVMFWDELTRSGQGAVLGLLLQVEFWWLLPGFGLLLLAGLVLRGARRGVGEGPGLRYAILLAAFTTGLSTMALQIALLFSFQSVYGFVYEVVGLIVAVFMCGLALGAYLTHRYVPDKTSTKALAAVQLSIALLAGLVGVILPLAAALRAPAAVLALFAGLTFASGLINGIDFPLCLACYMSLTGRAERTAGVVYGLELAGACLGAAAASVLIAPVLGIVACCLMAAVANLTAFVVLVIARGSSAWSKIRYLEAG